MRSLVVFSVLLLSGCGFIQVSTSTGSGPSGSGSSSEGAGSEEASRLKAAYDDFSAKGQCVGMNTGLCATTLRKAADIEARPHGPYDPVRMWNPREGANPDPEWIADWEKLPATEGYNESDKVFQVVAGALIAKANRKKCEADYKATYDARKKRSDELDGKIDVALKEASAHDRIHALLGLRPNDSDRRFVGARFRLEQELFRLFDDAPRRDAFAWLPLASPDTGEIRPLLSLETETRNYCAKSEQEKYFPAEVSALEDEIKKSFSLQLPAEKGANPHSLNEEWDMKTPFFGIDHAKIGSITRAGQGGAITYDTTRDESFVVSCRETSSRVVIQNGALRNDTNCTYGTKVYANSVKLTFADLPKVQLEKGDEIEVLAQITEATSKSTSSGATKKRLERKYTGSGIVVVKVTRGTDVIWKLIP